jgi:hypothetical protein
MAASKDRVIRDAQSDAENQRDDDGERADHEEPIGPSGADDRVEERLQRPNRDMAEEAVFGTSLSTPARPQTRDF